MQPRSGYAINAAVEALGDYRSVPVLRDIIFGDRRYFRELLTGSPRGLPLTSSPTGLKRLVAAGILVRDPGGVSIQTCGASRLLGAGHCQSLPLCWEFAQT